jgi:predicted transcriptional regulator
MSDAAPAAKFVELAADIVSAYVTKNPLPMSDLPALINEVHAALVTVASGTAEPAAEARKPAVSIRRSITPDYIICLDDGKKFKSLKRHLRTQYDLTPEQYRERWGLPPDYPMVAPNYAKARSELAKEMGLGQQGRKRRSGRG